MINHGSQAHHQRDNRGRELVRDGLMTIREAIAFPSARAQHLLGTHGARRPCIHLYWRPASNTKASSC